MFSGVELSPSGHPILITGGRSAAQVCVWEVSITPRDGRAPTITETGMDLIHVRADQLSRDHAFMDRMALPLLG